jgi:hypothetical protein
LECQKIEKHRFISKFKLEKISNTKAPNLSKDIEFNKAIEYFSESLSCLSDNLSESLKHIKSVTDVVQFRQKISSAVGQLSSSIDKLLQNLNYWIETEQIREEFANLSLPRLLERLEDIIIKNSFMKRTKFESKLTSLRGMLTSAALSINLLIDQVVIIIHQYQYYNNEAKNTLNILSASPVSRYSHEKFWPSCPQN